LPYNKTKIVYNIKVEKVMEHYIISLNNELFEYYSQYKLNNDIGMFMTNIENLLYFYFNVFYITGVNITRRKLQLPLLSYNININNINYLDMKVEKIKTLLNIININDYNDMLEKILQELIYIYRRSQLEEFKKNNIQEVIFITNNNSCNICKMLSKQKQNIDVLITELNKEHLYCYIKYDIISTMNLFILNKIKFSNKSLLTKYNFNLINNVDEIKELNKFYSQNEIEVFKNKFIAIQCDNNVYINDEYPNINYVLIKYSIKDKLHTDNWWVNKFNTTNIFINYKSRKNVYQYLIENVVLYILNPNLLKEIDMENYIKIKTDIFKDVEVR